MTTAHYSGETPFLFILGKFAVLLSFRELYFISLDFCLQESSLSPLSRRKTRCTLLSGWDVRSLVSLGIWFLRVPSCLLYLKQGYLLSLYIPRDISAIYSPSRSFTFVCARGSPSDGGELAWRLDNGNGTFLGRQNVLLFSSSVRYDWQLTAKSMVLFVFSVDLMYNSSNEKEEGNGLT
jgi:hypothetical protein